jgi:hypothetical protein
MIECFNGRSVEFVLFSFIRPSSTRKPRWQTTANQHQRYHFLELALRVQQGPRLAGPANIQPYQCSLTPDEGN